ncbi:ATP-binding protein [Ensifer sp. YR511]|uniref:ATP-binding protein n=1 Tax=Ensifer sp. YR511 TaxID=1855294 RepID=UPI000B7D599F
MAFRHLSHGQAEIPLVPAALLFRASSGIYVDAARDFPFRRVVFSVTDNRGDMTQDVQDRLFEPFFSTRETGNGLGLATVKRSNASSLHITGRLSSQSSGGRQHRQCLVAGERP